MVQFWAQSFLSLKKVIYDSFKRDKTPSIFQIKSEDKNHYYLEKCMHRKNGKIQLFKKNGISWHYIMKVIKILFLVLYLHVFNLFLNIAKLVLLRKLYYKSTIVIILYNTTTVQLY